MALTLWQGTSVEFDDLLRCIDKQCKSPHRGEYEGEQCKWTTEGKQLSICAAHLMLVDVDLIRHLLFVRRALVERMWAGEFSSVPLGTVRTT